MIKSELIRKIAGKNPSLPQDYIERGVNAILDEIGAALARDDRVELRDFGVFSVRHRKARIGRNPRTGAPVSVEAKKVLHHKTGRRLHQRLNPVKAETAG